MAYAIMRTAKLKSIGAISSCEKHNERERETINADKQRINENKVLLGDRNKSYIDSFNEITKDIKIRKNAVYAVECFMSASPDSKFFESKKQLSQWAYDSIQWLQRNFGLKNVVKVILHMDEITPHLHAFIVPIYENKLNCKKFLGGRDKLRALQTSYHKAVEKYGLERGIEGSKATHQDVKRYYSALNQELNRELPQPKILESKEKYKLKIENEYKNVCLKNLNQKMELERIQGQLGYRKSSKANRYKFKKDLERASKEAKIKNEERTLINYLNKNSDLKKEILNQINRDKIQTKKINRSR